MNFPKKTDLSINSIVFPILVTAFSVASVFRFYNIVLYLAPITLVTIMLIRRRIGITYQDILLILMAFFSYYVISGRRDGVLYALCFFSFYQLGKNTIMTQPTDKYSAYPVIVPATAMLSLGIINYSYLLRDPSILAEGKDRWPDWSGSPNVRTGHDAFLILMSALLIYFVLILYRKKNKWAILGIVASVAAFSMSLIAHGREPFVVCVLTAAVVMAGIVVEKGLYKRRPFRIAMIVVGVLFVLSVVAFMRNLFGIHDMYEDSFLSGDGGILHNIRFEMMYTSLLDAIAHPWGNNIEALQIGELEYRYAHNSWIECARSGGLLAFIPMVGFTISNVIDMLFCWSRSRNINKYALIAGFIGITLLCAVEPIYPGNTEFWSMEVYLAGLLCGVCDSLQDRKGKIRIGFRL